jgi:hypothetical protein
VLTVHQRWPGLAEGFELKVGGKTTVEVVYGITSLTAERADATGLLGLVRDHWRIENGLHYVRDVTLREDACRVRKGNAPQVLAAFRNAVVHLLADVDAPSRPAALELLGTTTTPALQLIGINPDQ